MQQPTGSIWKRSRSRQLHSAAPAHFAAAVAEDSAADAEREEAEWQARNVLAIEDDRALARRLEEQGCVLAEAGRFVDALARFDEAARRDPQLASAHECRAQVLMELGEAFEAVRAAAAAVAVAPDWAIARLTLGRAQRNLGELRLALGSVEAALARGHPDEAETVEEACEIERLLVLQNARARIAGGDDGALETRDALRAQYQNVAHGPPGVAGTDEMMVQA